MITCEKCNTVINEGELFCSMCGTVVICDNADGVIEEESKEFLLNYAERKAQNINDLSNAMKILKKIKDYKNASELLNTYMERYNKKQKKDKRKQLAIIIWEVVL